MIKFPEHIQKTMPYQAGKPIAELARETGIDESAIIKLASNENPLGMSPRAKQLAMQALDEVSRYPDAHGFNLKLELSKRFSVPDQWITLGNGSNDILEMVASTFLQPGAAAVFSQYAFIVYAQATQRVGADAIVVPAKDYGNEPGSNAGSGNARYARDLPRQSQQSHRNLPAVRRDSAVPGVGAGACRRRAG